VSLYNNLEQDKVNPTRQIKYDRILLLAKLFFNSVQYNLLSYKKNKSYFTASISQSLHFVFCHCVGKSPELRDKHPCQHEGTTSYLARQENFF